MHPPSSLPFPDGWPPASLRARRAWSYLRLMAGSPLCTRYRY